MLHDLIMRRQCLNSACFAFACCATSSITPLQDGTVTATARMQAVFTASPSAHFCMLCRTLTCMLLTICCMQVCGVTCCGAANYEQHCLSRRHQRKMATAASANFRAAGEFPPNPAGFVNLTVPAGPSGEAVSSTTYVGPQAQCRNYCQQVRHCCMHKFSHGKQCQQNCSVHT